MYINRLIEYAESHSELFPPLGFKKKRIQWIVDVSHQGMTFVKAKRNFECVVPDLARSSGTKPIFLVDKADYVFGHYDRPAQKRRSEERHAAYLDLLESYLAENDDQDIRLVLSFIKSGVALPHNITIDDFIAFRIRDDEWLHATRAIERFWKKHIQPESKNPDLPCMFCGISGSAMDRHSINFKIGYKKRTNYAKLISANENAYESHQLKNSFTAPTCHSCEKKYGQALEYFLQQYENSEMPDGPHMFRLGDLTYVYWLRSDKQLDGLLSQIANARTEQTTSDMREEINQLFTGIPLDRNLNNFCLLTLTSNKARLVVRDYEENSAGLLKERIEIFFESQDVGANRFYGIYALASTMYKEPTKQMQKYAIEEWMNWLLKGRPLSGRILIPLLKQIQAEGQVYSNQAAAIKSWLISQKGRGDKDMKLEEKIQDKSSYLCGRLFAILEKIQKDAINSTTTIATQYFGSASTSPLSTMGLLIRNAQNHLNKLLKTEKKEGAAIYYDRRMGELLTKISDFPQTLNLSEQAEFALGYYHEKQELYTSKKEKEASKNELQTN